MDTNFQAELFFINRLKKRYAHLKKWARRSGVTCYRLYDRDIPEVPLALDLYEFCGEASRYLQLYFYERPYPKADAEETAWLDAMQDAASSATGVPRNNIFLAVRRRHSHTRSQYEKMTDEKTADGTTRTAAGFVTENGMQFWVTLGAYIDTGLFLDMRVMRNMIKSVCANKTVLNLFCYTGSFSVYAAAGGASRVDSVDLSNTYLEISKKNMAKNKENNIGGTFQDAHFVRADVMRFIDEAKKMHKKWDIIIADVPTFSNSKKMSGIFDVNADWSVFVSVCIELLAENGKLFFSSNSKRLKFDAQSIQAQNKARITAREITHKTISEDFPAEKHSHRCWEIGASMR
ncbi:MAG: class I SAM-dependent methyltransferase [Treponemataceae bacterium]|nr:MAG: class I SAM-dependent methyltransferase [Treponemataceae bacterium]